MFTKEVRQQIVEDFAKRHEGRYDPALFVREVKRKGEEHPAYDWFLWDDDAASHEYRLWQARVFARNLTIKFSVEEVGRSGTIKIVQTHMPLILSPMDERQDGGGYFISDPNDPAHLAILAGEGAVALRSWLRRYKAALRIAGLPERVFEHAAEALEKAAGT
jgi:hypothetical protein